LSEPAFTRALTQLKETVRDLFSAKRTLPGFLLLYTSVDILASLTRPKTAEDTSSDYFKKWVEDYMLPGSQLKCNADDIWGARCGLLHTLTGESRMSRYRGAKMLNYIGTAERAQEMQQRHDPQETKELFLPTHAFVDAFLNACDVFEKAVQSNDELREQVYFHAKNLLVAID
jgi:hypothetical protein